MKITRLKQTYNRKVERWLFDSLPELTAYQKQKIVDEEIVRFAPFYFYEDPENEKSSLLWRLTLPLFLVYLLILILIVLPILWVTTGKWGISQKFSDKIHAPWCQKINVHI